MKKTTVYITTIILCLFLGFAGTYGLIYFYPNAIVDKIVTEEKKVTITDTGISEGISKIYDAAVVVEGYSANSLISTGSGFIYKKSNDVAYVMTNHHVIDGASKITLTFSDGSNIEASLKGSDEYADIAVLEIDAKYVTQVAIIGSNDDIKVGDTIFTVGSPMGKEYAGTVTRGILSGKDRMVSVSVKGSTEDWIMNVMQTDAAINPGNSGGPLCNVNGEVIGVNSLKIVQSSVEGLGFAIPIEDALIFADKITSGEKISRAYIGIEMVNLSSSLSRYGLTVDSSITSGVVVSNVLSESPASKAEIQKNDVIVEIGEYEINTVAELRYYLYKYKPGDEIKVKVYRDKDYKTLKVVLGEL